jgi:hypothetical protein
LAASTTATPAATKLRQPELLGQRGRRDQSGVGGQVRVVERDIDSGRGMQGLRLAGTPFELVDRSLSKINPLSLSGSRFRYPGITTHRVGGSGLRDRPDRTAWSALGCLP